MRSPLEEVILAGNFPRRNSFCASRLRFRHGLYNRSHRHSRLLGLLGALFHQLVLGVLFLVHRWWIIIRKINLLACITVIKPPTLPDSLGLERIHILVHSFPRKDRIAL